MVGCLCRLVRNNIPTAPALPPGGDPSVKIKLGSMESSELIIVYFSLFPVSRGHKYTASPAQAPAHKNRITGHRAVVWVDVIHQNHLKPPQQWAKTPRNLQELNCSTRTEAASTLSENRKLIFCKTAEASCEKQTLLFPVFKIKALHRLRGRKAPEFVEG